MVRLILKVALVSVVLGFSALSPILAADDVDRQKLIALFKNVQDVLLTINSEIIQYSERFTELSRRLQERQLWDQSVLEEQKLLPIVRDLNRLRLAVSMIGTGLEQKYAQLKAFQVELKDRYPNLLMEIDYHYNLFDKVYEDSHDRHRRLSKEMGELKDWFRQRVAQRNRNRSQEEAQFSARPFRKRHLNRERVSTELGHPSN